MIYFSIRRMELFESGEVKKHDEQGNPIPYKQTFVAASKIVSDEWKNLDLKTKMIFDLPIEMQLTLRKNKSFTNLNEMK